jgi:hypothetical protein
MDCLDLGPIQLVQLRRDHVRIGARGVRPERHPVLAREFDEAAKVLDRQVSVHRERQVTRIE